MEGQQPGQVFSPRSQGEPSDARPQEVVADLRRDTQPAPPPPAPAPQSPAPEQMQAQPPPLQDTEPEQQMPPMVSLQNEPMDVGSGEQSVQWTASEFIHNAKTPLWYIALFGATAALCALIYLFTRDYITLGVIVTVAVLFGVVAARKPQVQSYLIDANGITIGNRFYAYGEFKSFSIIDEGAFSSIALLPLKRFMPMLSIYYAPQDEPRIFELLGERLPFEQRTQDLMDRLMRQIRF